MNELYKKIEIIRRIKGLTQLEVAEKLSLTPQGYNKIEKGRVKLDLERLDKILVIFEMTLEDFVSFKTSEMFVEEPKQINNKKGSAVDTWKDKYYETLEKVNNLNEKVNNLNEKIAEINEKYIKLFSERKTV